MVFYKRKPVQLLPRPDIEDDSAEVWVIGETGEVFTSYDAYLTRMDFYKMVRPPDYNIAMKDMLIIY
jgi:hypothetical protein